MTETIDTTALVEQYFAMWTAPDATARADAIAAALATDCRYVDPLFDVTGYDGLHGMVEALQQQFPGHAIRQTGEVQAHHDRLRWTWELVAEGQPAVAGGVDYAVVGADGKLAEVTGFLEFAPAG
jgi:hypothetical protein